MQVSVVLITASPNGTLTCLQINEHTSGANLKEHIVLHLNTNLTSNTLDHPWKIVVFSLTMFCPWSEVAHLAVIPVIRQPHLWPNKEDLTVVNDNSTVVDDVLVNHRPGKGFSRQQNSSGQEGTPKERIDMRTYIPTSQTMSEISGDDRIRPRTSQECMTVSPFSIGVKVRNYIENL